MTSAVVLIWSVPSLLFFALLFSFAEQKILWRVSTAPLPHSSATSRNTETHVSGLSSSPLAAPFICSVYQNESPPDPQYPLHPSPPPKSWWPRVWFSMLEQKVLFLFWKKQTNKKKNNIKQKHFFFLSLGVNLVELCHFKRVTLAVYLTCTTTPLALEDKAYLRQGTLHASPDLLIFSSAYSCSFRQALPWRNACLKTSAQRGKTAQVWCNIH